MRVLNSLIDPRVGGPQLRALSVAKKLRESDIETIFLLPNGSDEFEELAKDEGFEVARPGFRRLRPPSQIRKNARYLFDFYPEIKRIQNVIIQRDVDVVHASMTLNFQAALAAWKCNVPLAWFFNDTGTPWPLNWIAGRVSRIIANDVSIAADAVHQHFFPKSFETRTIYPPVDTAKFNPDFEGGAQESLRREFDIDPDVPIIGTVGNVNPVKGHNHLLQAVAQVKEEFGPVSVLIAGSILDSRQDYFEKLQQKQAELDLEQSVHFVGHRSDIPRFLASLDVFAFPSVKEACPIAVLEAMAMELPIVATTVGGIPEEITDGEHGWLVPPEDSASLATAIHDALSSPNEAKRRGAAARVRANAEFSLQKCAERHMMMYEDII